MGSPGLNNFFLLDQVKGHCVCYRFFLCYIYQAIPCCNIHFAIVVAYYIALLLPWNCHSIFPSALASTMHCTVAPIQLCHYCCHYLLVAAIIACSWQSVLIYANASAMVFLLLH